MLISSNLNLVLRICVVAISSLEYGSTQVVTEKGTAKYDIIVETANAYHGSGGKDNLVFIEMTGDDGTVAEAIQLNKLGDQNFHRGETNLFQVETMDVGIPILITLELREQRRMNPWAVGNVKIIYRGQEVDFPAHDWVETRLTIPTGEGRLYQDVENPYVLSALKREMEYTKVILPWVRRPGPTDLTRSLPRYVDANSIEEVPLIFHQTETWTQSYGQNAIENLMKSAITFLKAKLNKLEDLESYHMLYQLFDGEDGESEFLNGWRSDEEFGRQHLNGIAPTILERCGKIPDGAQVSNDHVKDFLGGSTLDEEIKKGKVYMVDFTTVFRDVNRNRNELGEQLYSPDALCLFHVNSDGGLVPIAIQLVPGDPDTVFTPNDAELDWILAKMYYKASFSSMHEWYYHFLLTHGVMEPFAVAVFRDLPRSHPVYKLLRPHLQTITVINLEARNDLLNAGSAMNKALGIEGEEFIRKMYKSFDMEDLCLPCLLEKKGLNDENLLPNYYYRDDALELWKIIKQFVTTVIQHYYSEIQDIEDDKFLQEMMEDLAVEGIGWDDETHRKGVPYPMLTVDQLIRLCTSVIFTSSVQHSAVNYPQYAQFKYAPNSPSAMRLPPHRRGEATMERIMDSLPDAIMSLIFITIASELSAYAPDEVFLGDYPANMLFTDEVPLRAIAQFREDLSLYGEEVRMRNEKVKYPYEWLLPERIARSIAI